MEGLKFFFSICAKPGWTGLSDIKLERQTEDLSKNVTLFKLLKCLWFYPKPMDATINAQTSSNKLNLICREFWQYCECTKNYNINLYVLYVQPPKHSYKPTEIHDKPLEAVDGPVTKPRPHLRPLTKSICTCHNDQKQR